jgi:hypothetical protein
LGFLFWFCIYRALPCLVDFDYYNFSDKIITNKWKIYFDFFLPLPIIVPTCTCTEKAEIGPPYLVEFLQYFREGHHVQWAAKNRQTYLLRYFMIQKSSEVASLSLRAYFNNWDFINIINWKYFIHDSPCMKDFSSGANTWFGQEYILE